LRQQGAKINVCLEAAILFPLSPDQPVLVVIAGPNGSGKSSAYKNTEFELEGKTIWIVNPDLLAARISVSEALAYDVANLEAVQRIEKWLNASVSVHKSIGVETVLSTDKYRTLVTSAKAKGFAVWLIYVVLDSVERNIERVKVRVAKGGHDVPEDKIRSRWTNSLMQFPWFLDQADAAWVYDNSSAQPRLVARKVDGTIEVDSNAPNSVLNAIQSLQ
jgi:predicted ABC-type ATPase